MTNPEFSNEFDVLYNNIMSNAAPGLDECEKSVFLTKAQDEIVKSYFNPRLNKSQEGFDGNEKRQIDFSMITKVKKYGSANFEEPLLDNKPNTKRVVLSSGDEASDIMMFINEFADVARGNAEEVTENKVRVYYEYNGNSEVPLFTDRVGYTIESLTSDIQPSTTYFAEVNEYSKGIHLIIDVYKDENHTEDVCTIKINISNESIPESFDGQVTEVSFSTYTYTKGQTTPRLTVIPLDYREYVRLMSKPYKRPLKNQAWRLVTNDDNINCAEIIIGPEDVLSSYVIRYIKKPRAIRLSTFDAGVTLDGESTEQACELDSILHQEILQRAVELAKAAYTGDLNSQLALGVNSQTNVGMVTSR